MDVLVTGATGFVGANVARLLVADGYRVRVLARPASSLRALEGCPVELRRGDALEPDSVARAITGCARVFHVAGDYRLWAPNPGEIYRNNVDGTRTVLEACARARGREVHPRRREPLADRDLPHARAHHRHPRSTRAHAPCPDLSDRAGKRGARARHGPFAARAAHRRSHGPQAHVRQRGQGRAGARAVADTGRASAARCRRLVRRPRLRAVAAGLSASRRLNTHGCSSPRPAAHRPAPGAIRSWARSQKRGTIPWASSRNARGATATWSPCGSACITCIC